MTFPIFIKAGRSRISIAKEIKQVNRLRLGYERSMRKTMYGLFRRVGEASVAEYVATGDVRKAFLGMEDKVGTALRSHYSEIIETFGNRVFENRKMERFGQLLFQLYAREGAEKVVGISFQTREQILRAIKIGERDGIGVRKTAKLITERTSGAIARARATTIARTETHAAASFATHAATKELNLPLQKKRWVSVSDSRTRSAHAAVNGQEVGIDEKFVVPFKGSRIEMEYPHDGGGGAGNNINCRCLAIYFTDEDTIFDDVPKPKPVTPATAEKPLIDFSSIVQPMRFGSNTTQDISDLLNSRLTKLTALVASKVAKPQFIKEEPKGGYYQSQGSFIVTTADKKKGVDGIETGQTIVHEYGHCVDNHIGDRGPSGNSFWSEVALKEALKEDGKALGLGRGMRNKDKIYEKQKDLIYKKVETTRTRLNGSTFTTYKSELRFKGGSGVSDIIDGYAKGRFRKDYYTHGHAISYWKTKGSHEAETFAHLYAFQDSPEAIKWAKKHIPKTYAIFMKKMKEVADG